MSGHGWVGLLRGINLGARNKVPMAALRGVFEESGCEAVQTYIQSGNVVFTHSSSDRARVRRTLESAVEEAFGISTPIVLRSLDEMSSVAAAHPFGDDGSKTYVAFLAETPPAAKVRSLKALDVAPDRVEVAASDVFLHYANGVQGARLTGAQLERHLGVAATIRNWRTVTKLAGVARSRST